MITIVATFSIPEDNRERFIELAHRLAAGSRAEAGNASYRFVISREDAGVFAFIEEWADTAAVDSQNASENFTALVPRMVELSDSAPVITQYEEV